MTKEEFIEYLGERLTYEDIEKANAEAKAYVKGFIEGLEVSRPQGEWMCGMTKRQEADRWVIERVVLYCSECNGEAVKITKFCPNCGARMVDK